jgi:anti-sigma regulatory factor (Ser/Thr protein kinase)
MTSSRYAHSGHRDDSPLVPAEIPGIPLAPACCVIPRWIVIVDSERRETLPMAPGRQFSQAFPGRADQVRLARTFVRRVLVGCPVLNEAMLICSELSSNAIQHSASGRPGGSFTVRADVREGEYVWIGIEDQGGRWTTGKHTEERGRGLVVVDKLAAGWDVQGDDTGRVICALLGWTR